MNLKQGVLVIDGSRFSNGGTKAVMGTGLLLAYRIIGLSAYAARGTFKQAKPYTSKFAEFTSCFLILGSCFFVAIVNVEKVPSSYSLTKSNKPDFLRWDFAHLPGFPCHSVQLLGGFSL